MKSVKVKNYDVGRFVRVVFDDIGAVDGVITEVESPTDIQFFSLSDRRMTDNNGDPIVKVGNYVTALGSGL